ncbi:MAG: hypothetical protein J6Q12_09090 [Bacteroidales bacterium]|nr:hypothetical protein [Bacteroidales bacterium]
MNPIALFKDIADFRKYCDGLQADTEYRQLIPSIRSTASAISGIIGGRTLLAISELSEGSEGLEYLKTAVATGTLYRYQIFDSVKKNGSDASMYKYQHEEIKEHHISAHWLAMDELLTWLDSNPETGGYNESKTYRERQELPIKNAEEFDYYYGIDRSAYFFSKVQFLIRSVWQHMIKPMISGLEVNEELQDMINRSLCYQVVAEAVMKFDVTELPRSIRYDYNHEYTRGTSMQNRDKLYGDLMSQVSAWNESIENLVQIQKGATALHMNINDENNKFYLA